MQYVKVVPKCFRPGFIPWEHACGNSCLEVALQPFTIIVHDLKTECQETEISLEQKLFNHLLICSKNCIETPLFIQDLYRYAMEDIFPHSLDYAEIATPCVENEGPWNFECDLFCEDSYEYFSNREIKQMSKWTKQ